MYVTGQGGNFHGQQGIGSTDVFLTKFSAADVWVWTRLFGSIGADHGFGVHAGPDGLVYVTGHAPSFDFDGVPGTDGGVFLTPGLEQFVSSPKGPMKSGAPGPS